LSPTRQNIVKSTASSTPDLILLDMRPVLYELSPISERIRSMTHAAPQLINFLKRFTIQNYIEAIFVANYEETDPEARIWNFIESMVDGEFLEQLSSDTMSLISLLYEFIVEDVDALLAYRLSRYRLQEDYKEYLFHQWVDPYTAAFARPSFKTGA
jgi:hypothetical protein